MDEDNFQRGPATSHQLEPVDDKNVLFSIRGENDVKFDVNGSLAERRPGDSSNI